MASSDQESSEVWRRVAAASLADHEVHVFFEIAGVPLRGPAVCLSDLAVRESACIPADQRQALAGRYRREPVWQEATADVGPDIYDHLRDIVAGRRKDLSTVWELTPRAERLLGSADLYEEEQPADQRAAKRLGLTLSKRSLERLRGHGTEPRALTVGIERTMLHVFATGVAFLHVSLTIWPAGSDDPLSPLELLEAQVAVARFDRLSWRPLADRQDEGTARFSLGDLARSLVKSGPSAARETERPRTYTYLRLANAVARSDADLLALHLARHYTPDYVADPDIGGLVRIRAFANVGHVLSLEGATTIVAPVEETAALPGFLENFKQGTLRRHYIPIFVLGLHEYGFLVDRTSRSVLNPEDERDIDKTLATLARLQSDSLVFRICFRFSQVSHISMHNELNRGFREVLGLDRMLREFAADVAEIEAFLRAAEEHKARSRTYVFSMIGGAALAALSGLTIFRESAKVLLDYKGVQDVLHWLLNPAISAGWIIWPLSEDKIGLIAGFVVFVVSLLLLGRRRPLAHLEAEGESTMHHLLTEMEAGSKAAPSVRNAASTGTLPRGGGHRGA
jgi:hypothetical protein